MGARRVDIVASVAVVLGGVALAFIHYYGGSPGSPEGRFAAAGFASPFIGVGLLALVGSFRGRRALMLAAGVALIPMSILSFVLLPLLIPAVLLIVHSTPARLDPRDLAMPMVFAFVLVGALAILVFHQDPVTGIIPPDHRDGNLTQRRKGGAPAAPICARHAVVGDRDSVQLFWTALEGDAEPAHDGVGPPARLVRDRRDRAAARFHGRR